MKKCVHLLVVCEILKINNINLCKIKCIHHRVHKQNKKKTKLLVLTYGRWIKYFQNNIIIQKFFYIFSFC